MSAIPKLMQAYDHIIECVLKAPAYVQLSGCEGVTRTEEVISVDGVTGEFETEKTIYYPKDPHAFGSEEVVEEGDIEGDMLVNTPFQST
jgi:hypothetical protein